MNRYQETFTRLKQSARSALIPFWMLGYPDQKTSLERVRKLAQHADILELGLPFSDPLADGPTIQRCINQALEQGATIKSAFEQIAQIRTEYPKLPIGMLVYYNLMMSYGVESFVNLAAKSGVDSLLIPELPSEESKRIEPYLAPHQSLVWLASTNTSDSRLKTIRTKQPQAFTYLVSTPSVTGSKKTLDPSIFELIKKCKTLSATPTAVGFGVSSPQMVQALSQAGTDGVIIGSHLLDLPASEIEPFLKSCQAQTSQG